MKTLLVDFTNFEGGSEVASQAIKIFMHRHSKAIKLLCFGKENDLNTFEENESIEKIIYDKEYNRSELLVNGLKNRADVYVGTNANYEFIALMNEFGMIRDTVVRYTTYPTMKPNSRSLLTIFNEDNKDEISDIALKSMAMFNKLMNKKTENLYLLSPKNNSKRKIYEELDSKLKMNEIYKGIISANNVLQTGNSIIIALEDDASILIDSIEGSLSTYEELKAKQLEKGFLVNLGSRLMNKVFLNINAQIDKKMISNGLIIDGYIKKVIYVNEKTNAYGFAACLERGLLLIDEEEKHE